MHKPDPEVPERNERIARAETGGVLGKADRLVIRSAGQELALSETDEGANQVAIYGERHLELGNGILAAALRPKQLGLGYMRQRVLRGCGQSLVD
jgi:hypothetical protein